MGKAVRAIIEKDNQILLMHRNKHGSQYFTLIGGRVNEGETNEQALKRELKEETGLEITSAQHVFTEEHPEPYNVQYTYYCIVAPFEKVEIQKNAEEDKLNKYGMNIHTLAWTNVNSLDNIQFRTPQLCKALIDGFKNGFPEEPKKL